MVGRGAQAAVPYQDAEGARDRGGKCEAKVVNRVVRAITEGYASEGAQRHAELMIEQLLDTGMRECATPGVAVRGDQADIIDFAQEE
eukprot:4580075-Lingulodinium_polyedra.AAC.1